MAQKPPPTSNVRYSPPVSTSLDLVPEENRLIIDIWRQIDDNTWLLGDRRLLSRRNTPWDLRDPTCLCTWQDHNHAGTFFALHNAPYPPPQNSRPIRPLHDSSPVRLVYDAGGARLGQHASAIWEIGGVYLKIKYTQWTLPQHMPREHIILDALHQHHIKTALSFAYPKVLYHAEYNGRYYLITTPVPGTTVRDAWPAMNEDARQRCVENVASGCRELASWRSDKMGFVDGTPNKRQTEWLDPRKPDAARSTADECLARGSALGIDCSTFVFFHGDMGPTNVLVHNDSIGLVDWEYASFVPEACIPLFVKTGAGYNLDIKGLDIQSPSYAKMLGHALEQVGFIFPSCWYEVYLAERGR